MLGNLQKMKTVFGNPVQYYLQMGDDRLQMNEWIGKKIKIEFQNQINCIICGRKTKKSFAQGLCYPCMINAPQNAPCIIRPELCQAHTAQGKHIEWEQNHHLQPHIVYLAHSGGIKVGVTTQKNQPSRWIDQGATQALVFAKTPYRQLAGLIEVALKKYISDKTNWQVMLKQLPNEINFQTHERTLIEQKTLLQTYLPEDLKQYVTANDDDTVLQIEYPILDYPQKIKSINLDKTPAIESTLQGIKGQYLMFDGGQVFNIRTFSGYLVEINLV